MSILHVEELRKSYQQGGSSIEVLKGLNLTITKGETVAILGQSGSGKSTLLSLLAGLDHPTSGYIQISGSHINALNEKDLSKFRARHLAIIFQQFHLMSNLTAEENVLLPLEILKIANADAKARDALAKVGLADRKDHLPSMLSGGERQRVAIARAFVVKPDLLLADEPSGNLDSETGDAIMDLLFTMAQQDHMTMVLVTHNRDLAKRCNRVFELRAGALHAIPT